MTVEDSDEWPEAYPAGGYAVVDVETTGLAADDRVISIGVYELDRFGVPQDHWYTLVNPDRDPGPVWIHGLTSSHLRGAPRFPEVAAELSARLAGKVMVAHNAQFDWKMLAREYGRAALEIPTEQRLCTVVLSRDLALPLPNHRLATLAAHFGVVPERAHHALDDARVLAAVFRRSLKLAAAGGLRLPLVNCVMPVALPEALGEIPSQRRAAWFRPARRRPACPYPNPGRWQASGPLVQGMRVAITGDTAVDREQLEDRMTEAGLHVASSVSSRTSLLVTNEPDSWTTKARRAREIGTPVVDEAAFLQLLRDVRPQS
ncbi:DEDDh family exonuclease [Streptacidiphilus monticola]|uniref:DEDDh family exonuclease n=1 Tax=Streptacidiphilus monticola TaxID=2161674 RepID=A0ABW1FXX5_9ACTN